MKAVQQTAMPENKLLHPTLELCFEFNCQSLWFVDKWPRKEKQTTLGVSTLLSAPISAFAMYCS
jgi:hypothetical protein